MVDYGNISLGAYLQSSGQLTDLNPNTLYQVPAATPDLQVADINGGSGDGFLNGYENAVLTAFQDQDGNGTVTPEELSIFYTTLEQEDPNVFRTNLIETAYELELDDELNLTPENTEANESIVPAQTKPTPSELASAEEPKRLGGLNERFSKARMANLNR